MPPSISHVSAEEKRDALDRLRGLPEHLRKTEGGEVIGNIVGLLIELVDAANSERDRHKSEHHAAVAAMAKARQAAMDAQQRADLEAFAAFEQKTATTKLRKHAKRLRRALVEIVGYPPGTWQNANGTNITKALETLLRVTMYLERTS